MRPEYGERANFGSQDADEFRRARANLVSGMRVIFGCVYVAVLISRERRIFVGCMGIDRYIYTLFMWMEKGARAHACGVYILLHEKMSFGRAGNTI